MTPPWLIPIAYMPLMYWCYINIPDTNSARFNFGLFIFGLLNWTTMEYVLHRFLFHMEDKCYFLNNRYFFVAHFLLHGIHHAFPNDYYRIVFPPILGYPAWFATIGRFYSAVLPDWAYHAVTLGTVLGYICYDSIHF